MRTEINTLFFDLDHTLWDFEKNSALTFKLLFEQFEVDIEIDQFMDVYCPINLAYWKKYRDGVINKEYLRYNRVRETFFALNFDFDEPLLCRVVEGYITFLTTFKHLFPYVSEVILRLSTRFDLYIVTNGFKEVQYKKIAKTPIENCFKGFINADEVGYKKPNPIIFNHALEIANRRPEQVLMVGDDLEADVLGALNCGLHAMHFDPLKEFKHEKCPIFNCFSDFEEQLDSLYLL